MGKKMKLLPSLLKNTEVKKSSSSWPWPSCHQPRTLSFRANNDIFKTINSAYFDGTTTVEVLEISSESFFTVSPDDDSASFSTNASDEDSTRRDQDSIETVIRGLRSDRLFFEADETSSILESKAPAPAGGGRAAAEAATTLPFKDSVVLSMDSQDPYVDFRKSMEEMVEAHGVKDWEGLEKLLCWYLRVNGKTNHAYIVGAFVDLLVALALASTSASASSTSSTSSSSYSPSSPLSFYSSSMSSSCSIRCVSCLEAEDEDEVVDTTTPSSSSLFQQVKEEIKNQDEASSSSSSSSN